MKAWFAVAASLVVLTLGAASCGPSASSAPPPADPGGSASATGGRPFDTRHVNDIQKGTHEKAQMQSWFGPPFKTASPLQGHPSGCVERWVWVQSQATATGTTVTSVRMQMLVVDFDAAGKVCDHAFTSQ